MTTHIDSNYPIFGVKGEGGIKVGSIVAEVGYFSGLEFDGPGQKLRFLFNLSHTDHYIWLFYGKFTFQLLGIQLVGL